MPETPNEMLQLPGVTKANYEKYGSRLLEISVRYSAEKFTLLAEEQDMIEDFDDEPQPSTSSNASKLKTKTRSKPTTSTKKPVQSRRDEWIDMDSQESRVSSSSYKNSSKPKARKAFNFGAKQKSRKSSSARRKASPKKPSRTTAAGKKTSTKSAASKTKTSSQAGGGGLIGFMPMPMPR